MSTEAAILARVVEHCKQIGELMGERSFHVASTRRQFQRYLDYWPEEKWVRIAQAAVAALSPMATRDEAAKTSDLPAYA